MKLVKTMLWDEEPRKEDFYREEMPGGMSPSFDKVLDKKVFEQAHKAYTARRVKPEFKWFSIQEKKPDEGQKIYMDHGMEDWKRNGYESVYNSESWNENASFFWCDYESNFKALQHYNENRLRYAGFEDVTELKKEHKTRCFWNKKNHLMFRFMENGTVSLTHPFGELRSNKGLSTEEVELFCTNRGIELKII